MRPPALKDLPNNVKERLPRGDIVAIHPAETSSPHEQRTLDDLARLKGVQEVRSFGDGFQVAFPEADFVISLSSPRPDPSCETEWEVTVREAHPGLSTWWGRWHRSFSVHRSEAGPLIAEEVRAAISRVRAMLDDRARERHEAPVSDA
jgi:hypothetical protein